MDNKKLFKKKLTLTTVLPLLLVLIFMIFAASNAVAEDMSSTQAVADSAGNDNAKFAYIAAALAFGFGAIGAGIAISGVGAAAMGAIAEKPELGGQALIFVALAEGIVVLALVISILILNKV